jgi:elongation factor G
VPPDSIEQVRNLVLIGHRGCGKTSLAEAVLFDTGMTKRLGSVDQGSTTSDVDPEETERGISIMTALCYAEHRGHKVNIIDTPGYAEFIAETTYGIWAADIAALVLDAAAGVEVHTRKVWAMARERGLALCAVINKMDKDRANFQAAIAGMKEVLPGCHPVAVQLPMGAESGFSGVIDLLKMKAFTGKGVAADIPADLLDEAQAARVALVEAVVETHDELMEKYLADEQITPDELMAALKHAVAEGAIVPVVATAGLTEIGTLPLLDMVIDIFPNPGERPAWKGQDPANGNPVERKTDPGAPFSAVIFKTITDPYVGRISLLRVISGMGRADSGVVVGESGEREKMSGLGLVQGRTTAQTGELWPGDLGCVTRLEKAKTGDTLCDPKTRVTYPKPHLPTPMHSLALRGETRQDEDKMAPSLERAADEDAGFRYERSADTGELVVSGMGSLHLETVIARLQRQFGLKVQLSEPKIPYRETVTRKVRIHGRHKKQTGGRGQFGDVWVQLEPQPRGEGFEFVDAVVGGSVPNSFIPSVEKGCRAALGKGPLAGYPVVDVRATLDDGQTHPVDSSDLAFQLAGQIAMREALQEAVPILLEPIMNVEITAPEDLVGDLVSDLNSRRARILGMEPAGGGMTILRASVPLVEMLRYSADLRSMSQGRANYVMEFDRYDPVPQQLTEQIVARHKAAQAEDAS